MLIVARLTVAVSALLATAVSAAPHYRYTDLGILSGDESSVARAISDNGYIAGESGFGSQLNRVTRFDGGPQALPTLTGAFTTSTRGINTSGIAASVVQGDPSLLFPANDRAALVSTGGVTELFGAAGYAAAGAFDVTNAGVAVGFSLVSGTINGSSEGGLPVAPAIGGAQRATVWTAGSSAGFLLADPCAPEANCNSNAVSIGEDGQIAGIVRMDTTSSARAARWDAAGIATILALGVEQTSSRAREINDNGTIVGQVFGSGALVYGVGSIWEADGTQYLLDVPGFLSTTTRGISNNGTVVGFGYETVDEETGEFSDAIGLLWQFNGAGYDVFRLDNLVDNLGAARTFAVQSVNDAGEIVGFGPNQIGDVHAYLLTAVPEPASWALMIAGFGLTGATMRRRRRVLA